MARVRVQVLGVRVQVRVLCIQVRVLTKRLESESESLKIWTRVRLEYTVGLEYYITGIYMVAQNLREICMFLHSSHFLAVVLSGLFVV